MAGRSGFWWCLRLGSRPEPVPGVEGVDCRLLICSSASSRSFSRLQWLQQPHQCADQSDAFQSILWYHLEMTYPQEYCFGFVGLDRNKIVGYDCQLVSVNREELLSSGSSVYKSKAMTFPLLESKLCKRRITLTRSAVLCLGTVVVHFTINEIIVGIRKP